MCGLKILRLRIDNDRGAPQVLIRYLPSGASVHNRAFSWGGSFALGVLGVLLFFRHHKVCPGEGLLRHHVGSQTVLHPPCSYGSPWMTLQDSRVANGLGIGTEEGRNSVSLGWEQDQNRIGGGLGSVRCDCSWPRPPRKISFKVVLKTESFLCSKVKNVLHAAPPTAPLNKYLSLILIQRCA